MQIRNYVEIKAFATRVCGINACPYISILRYAPRSHYEPHYTESLRNPYFLCKVRFMQLINIAVSHYAARYTRLERRGLYRLFPRPRIVAKSRLVFKSRRRIPTSVKRVLTQRPRGRAILFLTRRNKYRTKESRSVRSNVENTLADVSSGARCLFFAFGRCAVHR